MSEANRYSKYEYEEEEEEEIIDPEKDPDNEEDDLDGNGEPKKNTNQGDEEIELDDGTKITRDELKKGYMRQSDYTRKTQELAESKKTDEPGKKGDYPEEDVKAAKYFAEIAKKEMGLMTRDEYDQERAIDNLDEEVKNIITSAKKDDGIKVKRADLINFMKDKNLPPGVAYREKYRQDILDKAIKDSKGSSKYQSDKGGKPKPGEKEYDLSSEEGLEKFALDQL